MSGLPGQARMAGLEKGQTAILLSTSGLQKTRWQVREYYVSDFLASCSNRRNCPTEASFPQSNNTFSVRP